LTAASANAAEGGYVPTYQYACTDCGDRSEVVQRFTDDPLTVCSICGGKLRKVFSPVGIVFKGSGWLSQRVERIVGRKLVGELGLLQVHELVGRFRFVRFVRVLRFVRVVGFVEFLACRRQEVREEAFVRSGVDH
jgi:putative FmdB family regulatory protein